MKLYLHLHCETVWHF